MDKVSVIIPTHNRDKVLSRAVKSAMAQTYRNIEILVVSDGFNIKTRSLVNSLKEKDNRIKFYEYEPAKGGNFARNYGIEKSKGRYVAFLDDDDDEWHNQKIEKQLEIFNNNDNIGLVYTGIHIIFANEKNDYNFHPKIDGNLNKMILLKNLIGTTSTVMIKKEVFKEIGVFDEELNAKQDYELWIRICQKYEIGKAKDILVNYYNESNNNQISTSLDKYITANSYIEEKHKLLFQKLSNKELNQYYANNNLELANIALRNNDGKSARIYIKRSFLNKKRLYLVLVYLLSFFDYKYFIKLRKMKS